MTDYNWLSRPVGHYVGEVIEYRPRITGGIVIAVVTAVHDSPLFGVSLTIRVTDGTAYWPVGTVETVSADFVSVKS